MTDFPLPPPTHSASPPKPFTRPASSNDGPLTVSTTGGSPAEEEEDYTIKCFCTFQVDDGNTVFCDKCETWQHIECYYYQDFRDGQPPDINQIVHSCIDCDPRPYDKKGAIERQKGRFYPEERRVKKAPTKAPKRRPKLSESHIGLTNGYTHDGHDSSNPDRTSGSPRDHGPPLKRPKTSHKSSHSMNFFSPPSDAEVQAARSSHTARKSHKMKQPVNGYPFAPYSDEFLHLYDNDPGEMLLQANLFNDIAITRSLSSWSHDVESLSEAANGLSPQDVFHRCDESLDHMSLPLLRKEQRVGDTLEGTQRPRWTYLTVDTDTPRDAIVGELRGKIGHMQDYVQDPTNRWDYLRHPAPFVFFHPKLPIYVDTRQEGSICRYLRRSCQPNLEMRTILENGTDYRFCFTAKKDIEAGSELTISWTLDEHIRAYLNLLNNPETKQEDSFDEAAYISDWVEKVLANFGGCACDGPDQCGLARYDRRGPSVIQNGIITNGKPSKGRNGHSKPTRTPDAGHTSNSRASSEGKKRQDDEGRDSRSSSGSNSRSREITPTRNGNGDTGTFSGLEISDREKRKIAALEKNFEQLEQDKYQPTQRKKKRTSASALSTPTAANSVRDPFQSVEQRPADRALQKQFGQGMSLNSQPNTPAIATRPRYVDTPTSSRKSGSPVMKLKAYSDAFAKRQGQTNVNKVTSPTMRRNYVSVSVQTDADDVGGDCDPSPQQPQKRRPYISLGKRLLMRCQQDRERMDEQRKASLKNMGAPSSTDSAADPVVTGSSGDKGKQSPCDSFARDTPEDTDMIDAPRSNGSSELPSHSELEPFRNHPSNGDLTHRSHSYSPEIKPPPPPAALHATTIPPDRGKPINGFRSTDLRVQLPSVPHLSHDPASAPSMTTATTPTVSRSPFSNTPSTYPPLFPGSTPSAVQPSPVKKVSLSEYFSRQKHTSNSIDKGVVSNATTQQNISKALGNLDEEGKSELMEGSAVVETPKKEDIDPLAGRKASV